MRKSIRMPAIKLPSFLTDLFGDLRDRRLLPLVAVLAVGILVVPVALSESGSDAGPASAGLGAGITPVPPGGSGDSQLEVVSNESAGLRDYRRRLDDDSKDPFDQLFTSPLLGGAELGGDTGPTTEIGGGSPTDPTTPIEPLPPEGDEVPPVDGDPESPLPPEEEPEPAYVVTLRAGPPDQMKLQDLTEPTILPSEENPLLVFNGLGDKDREAIFRVTSEVTAVYGEAECLQGTESCERLAVEEGSTISVVYGDDDRVYRLTVVGIQRNR